MYQPFHRNRLQSSPLDIKLDTIRDWLLRAANHSEKVNEIFLEDLKISKVELDEFWTFVKK
jgi:ribosomal protein S16